MNKKYRKYVFEFDNNKMDLHPFLTFLCVFLAA